MKFATGLSRQIALSMGFMAVGIVLLVQLSAYAFYSLLFTFSPNLISETDSWVPTGPEWIWMAITTLTAITIAVAVAFKLARRILIPLNSVAHSLRQVAQGDLGARASTEDHSLVETVTLVNDFNIMAERLQRMEREQRFWNAAIAHELRTPVTILRGRLQGLADGIFPPDLPQFRRLLNQVEGLTSLIEDLRIVGLADSGHLRLQWRMSDITEEIDAVMGMIGPRLLAAGFTTEIASCHEPVSCDPLRIRQALLALLENARCHAVPGRILISASISAGICRLCVEDQGPGIDEALVEHIFDAFQRGREIGTGENSGSGLGLAVVKAIAKAHGGNVVYRQAGEGASIFEISWPGRQMQPTSE